MSCRSVKYSSFDLKKLLPWPGRDAHKYSRGKLVVVAGCERFPGAAVLAALAGQRMGAGYVEVFCASEAVNAVRTTRPSLVVHSWDGLADGDFDGLPETSDGRPVAYVVGPGFDGGSSECRRVARFVLERAKAPVLVDGGAIDALLSEKGRRIVRERVARNLPTVVTPHGGEAARMAREVDYPWEHVVPADAAAQLAVEYGVTCVLKGPNTYVSDGRRVASMLEGTAALAKAGTGDVLAGMIGALLAQGMEAVDAAMLGATLHARAGAAAAERYTAIGVTAEDVIDCLPTAIRSL